MNTYIKNVGMTKTLININNKKSNKEIKWDGDYNGKIAKLNLNINDNGKKKGIHMELNNDDLLKLLNTPSINMPIDKRLEHDYLYKNKTMHQTRKYLNNNINKKRRYSAKIKPQRVKPKSKSSRRKMYK